jgi:hypothetical protein
VIGTNRDLNQTIDRSRKPPRIAHKQFFSLLIGQWRVIGSNALPVEPVSRTIADGPNANRIPIGSEAAALETLDKVKSGILWWICHRPRIFAAER